MHQRVVHCWTLSWDCVLGVCFPGGFVVLFLWTWECRKYVMCVCTCVDFVGLHRGCERGCGSKISLDAGLLFVEI